MIRMRRRRIRGTAETKVSAMGGIFFLLFKYTHRFPHFEMKGGGDEHEGEGGDEEGG